MCPIGGPIAQLGYHPPDARDTAISGAARSERRAVHALKPRSTNARSGFTAQRFDFRLLPSLVQRVLHRDCRASSAPYDQVILQCRRDRRFDLKLVGYLPYPREKFDFRGVQHIFLSVGRCEVSAWSRRVDQLLPITGPHLIKFSCHFAMDATDPLTQHTPHAFVLPPLARRPIWHAR
jgi:hypothetical protein